MNDKKKSEIIEQTIKAFKQYKLHSTYSLCNRFFSKKENKNLNTSITVMEMIFGEYLLESNQPIPFTKNDFNYLNRNLDESIDKILLADVLKILRCNKLIKLEKRNYLINNEYFYTDVRYRIRDKIVLQHVTPIMLSYIRTNVDYAPSGFFQELDKLFAHVLKIPISHNKQSSIEYVIYETIESGKSIEVSIDSNIVNITPTSIDINGAFKEVVYIEEETDNIQSIPLKEIFLQSELKYTPSPKKEKVVLAVNNTLYEYFKNVDILNPKTTKIHENTKGKNYKLYNDNNSLVPSANFFIVEAEETIEDIVNLVQSNLQHIKVLSPNNVKEAIRENIELYLKNDGIDSSTII